MALFLDQTLSLNIDRVRQIDNLDISPIPFVNDRADFFPEVRIDGRFFTRDPIDEDDDVILPTGTWFFSNQVHEQFVPITIKIIESDPGFDDVVDINPVSGRKELNLVVDMLTGRVVDANTNEQYATSFGQKISLEGVGDDDRGAIEFTLSGGADPNLPENALLVPPTVNNGQVQRMGDIASRGNSLAVGDFNNDGKDELVAGAPGQIVTTPASGLNTGGINIYSGTDAGLTTFSINVIQSQLGRGASQNSEQFGASVITGDFNGDENDDLVVGVPFGNASGVDAGAIHAIYGSTSGLNFNNDQIIHQGTDNFASNPVAKEAYGNVLAVADFNKDGRDDLVVGVPFDKRGNNFVGGVNVIYGSNAGLSETVKSDQFYNQSVPGMPGLDDNFQGFGEALAVGDFNSDGNMDLAIGVPNDRDGGTRAGVVDVIFGTRDGLPSDRDVTGQVAVLSQELSNILAQAGDEFGKALAVGDFNGDGEDDIAVGAPGRSGDRGVVYIYEGQDNQKRFSSIPKRIEQSATIGSTSETGDRFGAQLAAADIDGDGTDDLVISAPGENSGAGVAHLLFGSFNNGITTNGNRLLKQGVFGSIGGSDEAGDRFGTSLAIGNFDNSKHSNGKPAFQIAASAPGENLRASNDFGAVNIIGADALGVAGTSGMSVVQANRRTRNLQGGDVDGILLGNQRNNRLSAGGGGDIVLGMDGNDILNGQTGDDLLDGGKGRNVYVGGEGHDTFVISRRNGKAIIRDFEDGVDQIGLAHGLEFEDLTLKQRGRHTEIRLDDQSLALVRGTSPAQLSANDFVEVEYNPLQEMLVPSVLV